jgi:hypothetical protein
LVPATPAFRGQSNGRFAGFLSFHLEQFAEDRTARNPAVDPAAIVADLKSRSSRQLANTGEYTLKLTAFSTEGALYTSLGLSPRKVDRCKTKG